MIADVQHATLQLKNFLENQFFFNLISCQIPICPEIFCAKTPVPGAKLVLRHAKPNRPCQTGSSLIPLLSLSACAFDVGNLEIGNWKGKVALVQQLQFTSL